MNLTQSSDKYGLAFHQCLKNQDFKLVEELMNLSISIGLLQARDNERQTALHIVMG